MGLSRGHTNKHTHPSANKPSPKQNHSLPTVTRTQKNSPELSTQQANKAESSCCINVPSPNTSRDCSQNTHTHPRTITITTTTTTTRGGEAPAEGKEN